ncbi:MAG: FAD binding domain-containing protein [Desulfatiglandales bacterium]
MRSFNHVNAKSVREAVRLLQEHKGGATVLAGGTDLLGVLKDRILASYPETVINIKTIPNLEHIEEKAAGLKIGALTRLVDIVKSPIVLSGFCALAEAAKSVATPLIRNMGTIGGNLCQDVRCWYYRYPHQMGGRMICRRKGKGPCFAVKGDNRYNAIMGAKACFAVCPSDTAIALTALGSGVKIVGPNGTRTLPIGDFYTPMGYALNPDEILTEIKIPKPPQGCRQTFLKFTLREPVDFAVVSVASLLTVKDGVCTQARIVLGGVAPTPLRARGAEQAIEGRTVNKATAEEAAEAAVSGAKPLSKNAYKIEITKALVKRAILSQC